MVGPKSLEKFDIAEDPKEKLQNMVKQLLQAKSWVDISSIIGDFYTELKGDLKRDPDNQKIKETFSAFADIYTSYLGALKTGKTVAQFQESVSEYLPKEDKNNGFLTVKNDKDSWKYIKIDFNKNNSIATPFSPAFGNAVFTWPQLTNVYLPGPPTYSLINKPFAKNYDINISRFGMPDLFGQVPNLSPPNAGEGPDQVRLSGWYKNVNNSPLTIEGKDLSLKSPSQVVNPPEVWFDAGASIKQLSSWVVVNSARWVNHARDKMSPDNYGQLDLLFRDGEKTVGETMVFVDDKKNGTVYGWYNDGQGNWFKTGAILQDGKPVPGSNFEGELNLEDLKVSAQYMKNGENDVFFTVVHLPKAGLTGIVQQTSDGKSSADIVKKISGEVSIQAGYFHLKSGSFFGTDSISDIEGGDIGLISGKSSVKIYAGKEKGKVNVIGIEGTIEKNTYLSYFVRRDEGGKPTNSNIELSHTQKLGENTELRTNFRQILDDSGNDRGSGTIEIKSGDTRIAFAFDNITNADYWDVVDDYLKKTKDVRNTRDLLLSTREYLNSNVLTNAKYPVAQIEVEQKGYGKLSISALKDDGGQLTYTSEGGITSSIYLDKVSKKVKAGDLGFTIVYNPKDKNASIKNAFFQADKEKITFGGKIDNVSLDMTQSLQGLGTRLKGLYQPGQGWGYGGVIGTQSLSTDKKKSTQNFFIGGLVQKNGNFIFPNSQLIADAVVYPTPGIYSFGLSYNTDYKGLMVGFGGNLLMMQKGAPSQQFYLTLGYRFGKQDEDKEIKKPRL